MRPIMAHPEAIGIRAQKNDLHSQPFFVRTKTILEPSSPRRSISQPAASNKDVSFFGRNFVGRNRAGDSTVSRKTSVQATVAPRPMTFAPSGGNAKAAETATPRRLAKKGARSGRGNQLGESGRFLDRSDDVVDRFFLAHETPGAEGGHLAAQAGRVHSGQDDDMRPASALQFGNEVEPVVAAEIDVEQADFGLGQSRQAQGFLAVGRHAGDLQARRLATDEFGQAP